MPLIHLIAAVLVSPLGASAPEGETDVFVSDTIVELESVQVTGRWDAPEQQGVFPMMQRVDVAHSRESGITSIVEALAFQPSLRVSRDAMMGISVSIGALPASSTLILLNGVPITGRTNGRIDLSALSTLGIDRVEVVTGPMAHFYGSGSAAGVVNFITRHHRQASEARASVSSIGQWQKGVMWAKPEVGTLYLERRFFDGWDSEPDGKRSRQWNQQTTYNTRYSKGVRSGDWHLRYQLGGSWDQIKDRGDRRSIYSAFATDQWIETWNGRAQIDAHHKRWVATAAYDWADRTLTRYNRNLVQVSQEVIPEPGNPDRNQFGEGMVRVAHMFPWSDHDHYRQRWIAAYHGQYQWIAANRLIESWMGQGQHGGLVEYDAVRGQHHLEMGVRAQWVGQQWSVIPCVQWIIAGEKAHYRLNASNGFRAPDLKERFLWFYDASHSIEGNPDLLPEVSRQLGFNWSTNSPTNPWSAELQWIELKDAIQLMRQWDGTYTYVNVSRWESRSIQLTHQLVGDRWRHDWHAQGLWFRPEGEVFRSSPSVQWNLSANRGSWKFVMKHQTQWGLWFWDEDDQGGLVAAQYGTGHLGQVSLRYTSGVWSWTASIHNLYNQQQSMSSGHASSAGGLAIPGRHVRLGVQAKWK